MTADTATDTASLNGTTPVPSAEEPCEDCATNGEKGLAILTGLFALFILAVAVDIFTGGKVTGYVKAQVASGE